MSYLNNYYFDEEEKVGSFSFEMDRIIELLSQARGEILKELAKRKIPDLKIISRGGRGIKTPANDRRMYFWISCYYRGKEYCINLFESEIDTYSGNCHCQLGKIMFTKGYIVNKGSCPSPNEIIKDENGDFISNREFTLLFFNSYKWVQPFDFFINKDRDRLFNKCWLTVDDVLTGENSLTGEIVDAFLRFIDEYDYDKKDAEEIAEIAEDEEDAEDAEEVAEDAEDAEEIAENAEEILKTAMKDASEDKWSYGNAVTFHPILYTKPVLFIPKCFGWETEGVPAVLRIYNYEIKCNLGTKLLFMTDEGIKETELPFEKNGKGYSLDLITFFRKTGIAFEKGTGVYCDGAKFTQKDSTSKIIYNRNGKIEYQSNPYWGEQYELDIVNKKSRPWLSNKEVRIIRFNYCEKNKENEIEEWFMGILNKTISLNAHSLDAILGKVLKNKSSFSCSLFYQKDKDYYDWEYYRPV